MNTGYLWVTVDDGGDVNPAVVGGDSLVIVTLDDSEVITDVIFDDNCVNIADDGSSGVDNGDCVTKICVDVIVVDDGTVGNNDVVVVVDDCVDVIGGVVVVVIVVDILVSSVDVVKASVDISVVAVLL